MHRWRGKGSLGKENVMSNATLPSLTFSALGLTLYSALPIFSICPARSKSLVVRPPALWVERLKVTLL